MIRLFCITFVIFVTSLLLLGFHAGCLMFESSYTNKPIAVFTGNDLSQKGKVMLGKLRGSDPSIDQFIQQKGAPDYVLDKDGRFSLIYVDRNIMYVFKKKSWFGPSELECAKSISPEVRNGLGNVDQVRLEEKLPLY